MPRRGLLISLAVFALAGIGGMGVLVKRSSQSRGTLSLAHNTITVTAQDQSERVRVVEAEVTNTGVKPVTITRITSSCGCTTPQLPSGTTILPGRSMRLPVRLQLPAAGERKGSRVVIETADDKSDPVEVRFELVGYTLKPPYIVSQPERITLSTSDPSQRCIGRLRIHTCENRGAHWLNTLGGAQEGTTVTLLTVSETSRPADGALYRTYEWQLACDAPASARKAFQVVPIGGIASAKPVKPVLCDVVADLPLRAVPASITARIASGESYRQKVLLIANDDHPWVVTGVTSDVEWVRPSMVANAAGAHQMAEVEISPDGVGSSGTVSFATTHPSMPTISVTVQRRSNAAGQL
jgi:hypothetical protein